MSTTTIATLHDGTLAPTHRDRVLTWREQAQAMIDRRLAEGCTPEEALRAAAAPLRAGRRAQDLCRLGALDLAHAREGRPESAGEALEPTLRRALTTIAEGNVRRKFVRGGYREWQVLGAGGRVVRTLRGQVVQTLIARGLVRVTTAADAPLAPGRVVVTGVTPALSHAA
jgi:hypothetical protein